MDNNNRHSITGSNDAPHTDIELHNGCSVNAIDVDNHSIEKGVTKHLDAGTGPQSMRGLVLTHATNLTNSSIHCTNDRVRRIDKHCHSDDRVSDHRGVGTAVSCDHCSHDDDDD